MKTEVREAAVISLAVALGGVLLGVLWWWLAPHVPLIGDVVEGNWVVYLKDTEGEQGVGVDGTFTLLGLGFGAVSALVVFLLAAARGCAAGGGAGCRRAARVVAGVAARGVARARGGCHRAGEGCGAGCDVLRAAEAGREGGVAGLAACRAVVLHLGLTALFGPRDPEPEFEHGHGPYEAPPAA
ncbi:hypothetical protein GCM10011428_45730 [Streptomyces violaceus]